MTGVRLAPVFIGSLARRPAATLFSLAAIVLGVALGTAVQAVHHAALAEFDRGLRVMAGSADLRVVGPRAGFDEKLYALLAGRPEVAAASPLVEVEARLVGNDKTLPLVGGDIFVLARVTPGLLPQPAAAAGRLAALADDGLFVNAAARAALGVKPGDSLQVQAGSGSVTLRVAGDLPGAAGPPLAFLDIAAVQERFSRVGRLTRIDLRLADGVAPEAAHAALQALLPAGVLVESPQAAENEAARLSQAYRVNLALLAAMALVAGSFLVFSAQALSVVRRCSEFAFLRALGLSRRRLFAWLVGEGAALGLVGGLAGMALGQITAGAALHLHGGDLGAGYFAGLRPPWLWLPQAAVAYLTLGVLAGIAGAWLPARAAAAASPAAVLKAGDAAACGALAGWRGHSGPGLALLAAGLAACAWPPWSGLPVGGYVAVACLLAGGVLLLPVAARGIAGIACRLPARAPVPVRLAAARLAAAPGDAVVAAAGVLVSVALVAAMAIMVVSFRQSVDQWLHQMLPADLYVRAGRAAASGHLDPALQARIAQLPGAGAVNFSRHDSLRLAAGQAPVALIARPLSATGGELPLVGAARPGGQPAVWVSEAVRDLYRWQPGQQVELPIGGRPVAFHVAGVWRDYARQTGALMIDLADYRRLSGDWLANDAAITLAPGVVAGPLIDALAALAAPGVLDIARPGEIRAASLKLFDRTFAVTYVLETVAVAIGLAGVAARFAALAAARRREFGMLRHLGLGRRQIGWLLATEGALAAGVGVLGGLPVGGAVGLVLIEVVNRQSFHWSMDLHVPAGALAAFAAGIVLLAALAAVLAGRQAMRQEAVLAVRDGL